MSPDTRVKLLVVKTGDTLPPVIERYGDFDRMFTRVLDELGVVAEVVEAHKDEPLPDPERVGAAIITGSPHSVTDRQPWVDVLSAWTREMVEGNRFVLGVCYGHQLLAHAMGGEVDKNPNGYEVGTIEIDLVPEAANDPLLGAVARGEKSLAFHSTHSDSVVELPPRARLLAKTARTPVQAFAIGERAWGVQFHPEFTENIMRLYIEGRRPLIEKDALKRGIDPAEELRRVERTVTAAPHGPFLLRRFVEQARLLRVERVTRA